MDDEHYYQAVLDEMRVEGGPREALWLKASVQANGDERTARLAYVRLRVAQMKGVAAANVVRRGKQWFGDVVVGLVIFGMVVGGVAMLIGAFVMPQEGEDAGSIIFLAVCGAFLVLFGGAGIWMARRGSKGRSREASKWEAAVP